MFNVNSSVEMLLLFQLHSVQSLWGFSFTFLCSCDLVKVVWQGSCKTCGGLGNSSSRRGQHLVFLAACGYFEIRGKDPAFVSPVVLAVLQETLGFLLAERESASHRSCQT